MQANLKGGNAFVRLLLTHGEKIGMAGIVVCAALLLWSAMGRERLGDDQDPEDLQQLSTRADAHIKSFRWDDVDQENLIVAQPVSSEMMKEIPRRQFPPYDHGFDRRLLEPIGLRSDPVLLTAEDLEVHGDSGLWAFSDPNTIARKQLEAIAEEKKKKKDRESQRLRGREENARGAGPRGGGLYGAESGPAGRRGTKVAKKGATIVVPSRTGAQLQGFEQVKADSWVTLLAKVPIELQNQHYDEALQTARGYDPQRDLPVYRGYQVQRAEITDAGQGDWKLIMLISGRTIRKTLDTYPVNVPDVIDPDYNHPVLTHPLPPLILREWGKQASHSSMPLLSEREENVEEEEEEEIDDNSDEDDLFAGPTISDRRGMRSGMKGPARRGASRRGAPMRGGGMRGGDMGMMEMGMGMEMGGMGMGMEMGGGMGGRGMSTRRAGAALSDFTWDGVTSHVLLRYFDNSATPGRKYRYRIRLAIGDVNHNLPKKGALDPSVSERRGKLKGSKLTYRFTDWSKPSPIASVPLPARVYLVSAKPAKEANFNAEPEVELLIKALNSQYAAEIARADHFPRGSVINAHEKVTVIWSNYKFTTEQDSKFDFRTGVTLLDFRGGEKLSNRNRDLTVPTRAVLMDAAGRLFLQEELEDTGPVDEYQQALEGGQDSRRNPRGAPGGLEGMGGEFGGEFGF